MKNIHLQTYGTDVHICRSTVVVNIFTMTTHGVMSGTGRCLGRVPGAGSCLGEVTGTGRCFGEVSHAGSCLEGVPGAGEGLEDDAINVDVSTIGHATSSEAMVDVSFVQKPVSFYTKWMMRSKGKVSMSVAFTSNG